MGFLDVALTSLAHPHLGNLPPFSLPTVAALVRAMPPLTQVRKVTHLTSLPLSSPPDRIGGSSLASSLIASPPPPKLSYSWGLGNSLGFACL